MSEYEIIFNGYFSEQYKYSDLNENKPRLVIIIWPSTGGNARSFRIKESELSAQKILLIRYNPTSHGNSFGNYNPSSSMEQLVHFLKSKDLLNIPVVGIGHSGGGAALVMMEGKINFLKRFLLSPILNSRLSLEYLYENGNIHEFLELLISDSNQDFSTITTQREILYSRLANRTWLKNGNIEGLDFPVSNQRIHLSNLATFLRNLFLPGFDITEQLLTIQTPIEIFLPSEDKWFPRERTIDFASHPKIRITQIESAKDHFFSSSWLSVWQKIKTEIYT